METGIGIAICILIVAYVAIKIGNSRKGKRNYNEVISRYNKEARDLRRWQDRQIVRFEEHERFGV